jgi:hypothetical protein
MDKPTHSGSPTLSALDALLHWLQTEPPQSKHRDVLVVLALRTRDALTRGIESPVADVRQLAAWHRDQYGGPAPSEPVTGKWLPAAHMERWWASRETGRRQFAVAAGCTMEAVLAIDVGGGRGNQTTYRFRFVPLPSAGADTTTPTGPDEQGARDGVLRVTYKTEPAQPSWLARLVVGQRPFVMRSARGTMLVVAIAAPFVVSALCVLACALIVWNHTGALAAWLGPLSFAATLGALATVALRPFWQLPTLRVTIAPEWALAFSQFYAQLRLTRDNDKKRQGRFGLVRFHASCAVCVGTVEVRDGGRAFPGRLVGCCSDNPREHVYSFDAVTLGGRLLVER